MSSKNRDCHQFGRLHIRVACCQLLAETSYAYETDAGDDDDDEEVPPPSLQSWTRVDWLEFIKELRSLFRLFRRNDSKAVLTGDDALDGEKEDGAKSALPPSALAHKSLEKVFNYAYVHAAIAPIRNLLESYKDGNNYREDIENSDVVAIQEVG